MDYVMIPINTTALNGNFTAPLGQVEAAVQTILRGMEELQTPA